MITGVDYANMISETRAVLLQAIEGSAFSAGDESDELALVASNLTDVLRSLYVASRAAEGADAEVELVSTVVGVVDAEVQPAGPGYITLPKNLQVPGVETSWDPEMLREYANIYLSNSGTAAAYGLLRALADQIEAQS